MTDSFETNTDLDSLGPIDFVVVEFPANERKFTGEMVEELLRLVQAGLIRVVDVLILVKDADGVVDALELSDVDDDLGPLEALEAELAELLAAEDVVKLGPWTHHGGATTPSAKREVSVLSGPTRCHDIRDEDGTTKDSRSRGEDHR